MAKTEPAPTRRPAAATASPDDRREADCPKCQRAIGVVRGRLQRHKVGGSWCSGSGADATHLVDTTSDRLAGAALPLEPTWDEAVEHWLVNARGRGGGYAVKTRIRYRRVMTVVHAWFIQAGATKPSQVTERLAARWLAARVDGGSTQGRPAAKVVNEASIVRCWHQHLRAHCSLPLPDLTETLHLRGHRRSRQHYEPMQQDDVRRAMWWMTRSVRTPRQHLCAAVLALGLCLGLRRSEMYNLRIGHLDLSRGRLRVQDGKGGKHREIPVPPGVRDVLARYLSASGGSDPARKFLRRPRDDRGYAGARALQAIGRRAQQLAGVRQSVCLHGLRHTAARLFYERSGRDLRATQHFLGHSSPQTTIEYLDDVTIADLVDGVPDVDMFADAA